MELNWLYRRFGDDFGPVSLETLHELRQSGLLDDDDLVRNTAETEWRPATSIPPIEAGSDFDMDVNTLLANAEAASAQCIRRESEHRDTLLAFGRRSYVPGQKDNEPQVSSWYYRTLGHVMGPYTFEALKELAQGGTLERNDDVREGEDGVWLSAKRLPELFPKKLDSSSSVNLNVVEERAEWICRIDGDEQEPMKLSELQNLISAGQIERKDMVRRAGGSAWIHAQDVSGLKFTPPAGRKLAPSETPAPARSQKNSDPILDYLAPSKESAELAASNTRQASAPAPAPAPSSYTPSPAPSYSSPPPAYTPQYRAPVSAPPPPPARSRSSSGPSWSFSLPSGLLDGLKNPKLLGGIGASIAVVVLVFGMRFLAGSPGSKEFATVQQMWTEIDDAMKTNAGDAAFKAMSDKHLSEVKALRKQIEPRASAQNRLAQIVLYCTRDHLPKIYTGGDTDRKKQYERMKADMQEASELYQRANG